MNSVIDFDTMEGRQGFSVINKLSKQKTRIEDQKNRLESFLILSQKAKTLDD